MQQPLPCAYPYHRSNKEFLNDSLVDFYLKFLQDQLKETHPEVLEKCHFFNSFFYKRLLHTIGKTKNPTEEDRRKGYALVRRWAKVSL
jgi:Ulp1 family protease